MIGTVGTDIPCGATWVRFPRLVGDAVMQLPILRLLRMMGVGPIVVYGPQSTVGLVEGNEFADCVVAESEKPDVFALSRLLVGHEPERAICFPKSLRPPMAAWLAGVPERIGVRDGGAGLFNTHHAPFWKAPGLFVARYRAALAKRWPDLPALPYAGYVPGAQIDKPDGGYICLLPRAASVKNWPLGHFRELALQAARSGLHVVVLGTASEKAMGDAILDGTLGSTPCGALVGNGRNLCGQTNLRQAAAWLHGALAAVGNDSGLSHLAAACGTKTIAIFGPTDPTASAPWGPNVTVLKPNNLPCSPCFRRKCPLPERGKCLSGTTPEQVWECINRPQA